VADLSPRLRSTVQVSRQHFRGQMWHVLQDPSNNQFFRLNEAAYRFVALLDGRRTVTEVWRLCNEQLGDSAPTQGEVIQLLGQLYTSNLMQCELPPDAEGLFNRYRKRVGREIRSYLANILFARIPVLDPDRFLDRWAGVLGWVFSWVGALVLLALLCVGGYFVVGRFGELASQTRDYLNNMLLAHNVLAMYGTFILVKVVHEFGHAFACKKFGRQTGSGGEVHVMGVMFLVFTPMPYVDASSSWAFRSKLHRMVVGAGGMLVELGLASIAAVVWANTAAGSMAHAVAYNVMFIASISTIIFNANPLLRYDGYYMLSDLIEIPNLAFRSRNYLQYLVKKYIWGVRQVRNPAHTAGERAWFILYGIASTIYRTVIVVGILLFVASKVAFLGAILAVAAGIAWLLTPLGKFLHYLLAGPELMRKRARALATTGLFVLLVLGGVGLVPAPDRVRVEAVAEPVELAFIHAGADGFIMDVMESNQQVGPEGPPLIVQENLELVAYMEQLQAQRQRLIVQRDEAQKIETGAANAMEDAIAAADREIARVAAEQASLRLRPPMAGMWISPQAQQLKGAYVHRGDKLGMVASPSRLLLRAVAGNDVAARLIEEAQRGPLKVQVRVQGRADIEFAGVVANPSRDILPGGQDRLPSAALGYAAGGSVAVDPKDRDGTKAADQFFEIRVTPIAGDVRLLAGQRVIVRFETQDKPLALQWYRSILQLVQRKFA
jgi:putative peptide zinc metalloprotease protein